MHAFDGTDPALSWGVAIVVLLVVTGVVYLLLRVVRQIAEGIDLVLAEIWVRGQRVANNTIHIGSLYRTRDLVSGIAARTPRIASHATAILEHAENCPGCPQCMLTRH